MANRFYMYQGGITSGGTLASGGTTLTSPALANLPAVTGSDSVWIALDADGSAGAPEVAQITAHTGAATTATISRGQQGTTARSHVNGTDWVTIASAADFDELPFRKVTTKGDILAATGANAVSRLAVGTDGLPLVANSAQSTGLNYAALGTSAIQDSSITTAKIVDGTIGVADLSTTLLEVVCPAGTIRSTINTSADTGWLLFGQTVVGAQSTYPTLWAKAPAAWKSGSDLVLPSDDQVVLMGASTGIGAAAGSNTVTLATGNMPAHTHTIDHDHPAGTTSTVSSDHSHPFNVNSGGESAGHYHNAVASGAPSVTSVAPGAGIGQSAAGGNTFGTESLTSFNIGDHVHNVAGNTGGVSANHTHTFDVAAFSGSSGSVGSGTAVNIQQAAIKVRFQIKAH